MPEEDRIEESRLKGFLSYKSLSDAAKDYNEKANVKVEHQEDSNQ